MSWWDDLTTRMGDALVNPQMPFGFPGMPTPQADPRQRQQMIGNALLQLGGTVAQGGAQGMPVMASLGQGFQNLAKEGQRNTQNQLQMGLLGERIGESRRKNQTIEMLGKTPAPAGWSPDTWKAFVSSNPGEAFKVYADTIRQGQDRAAIAGMGAFPGMPGAGGGTAPTGSYDAKLARVESPDGRDNMLGSGAVGNYQFMPKTAHSLAQQTSWGKGLSQDQVIAAIKDEVKANGGKPGPKQQELLGLYNQAGDRALTAAGLPINDATRYAVHWFGAAGGPSLLKADPSMPLDQWVRSVNWGKGVSPETVYAQNPNLRQFRTVGDLRAKIAGMMGGQSQPAPMPQPNIPGADSVAPMPQPNLPGANRAAPMPNMATAGVTAPNPVQPAQMPAPAQGQPQAPAAPQIDYQSDPVIREAANAARIAQGRGDVKGYQEARAKAAGRIAEMQKEAQQRADRPGQMVELEDGKWLVDPRTGEKIKRVGDRPTPRGEGREFTEEDQLRKEYTTQTKAFQEYRSHYQRIVAANEKPSPAGDIALVYGFMKMLDPTSVVREGEFATASNAGGIDDRLRTVYNKIINGERLTPDVRKDFMDRASRIFDKSYGEYEATRNVFRGLATAYGRNPDRVTPDFTAGVKRPTIAADVPTGGSVQPPGAPTAPPRIIKYDSRGRRIE